MKIGVFGGAFDPPHLGHLHVALAALEQHLCDEVWFVPVGQHPFDKHVEANRHRVQMLAQMIEDAKHTSINTGRESLMEPLPQKLKLEEIELKQKGKSFSIDTLDALKALSTHQIISQALYSFTWIVGSDQLSKFDQWREYDRILNDYGVLVYERAGFPLEPWWDGMKLIEGDEIKISSSYIKEQLKKNGFIIDYVSPGVEAYIRKNSLYQEKT